MRIPLGGAAAWLLLTASVPSFATIVSGSVTFDSSPAGIFGNWNIAYNTADPVLKLTAVTIDIAPKSLFLDTNFNAPGALLPLPFLPLTLPFATGFTGAAGANDGSTSFTLSFSDFGNGENYNFELDVDKCSDDAACALVSGLDIAGATVTFTLAGGPYGTRTITAPFTNIAGGIEWDARASFTADIPEPATWMLSGSALGLLAWRRRRRGRV